VKRTSGLGFIFITLLIDILGIGLLIPILPEFIAHLSHQSLSDASIDYGWLLSLYPAMQFLFSPLMGTLSDRYGRRPILLLSLLFTGVEYVMMALAPSMLWLYLGRVLSGITGASITAASAYIADVSPPEKRSQNFGLIGAAFGVGFIIGPAAGGFLGQWGPRVPFWVAAGLCFANLLYGYFILPESLQAANQRRFSWREANPIGALRVIGKYPVVWGLTGALTASNLAMHCINSTWVLFTMIRFNWGPRETGLSLGAFGVVALVYQLGLARIILPIWGERRTMLIGLAVAAVEFTAYACSTQGWMIYVIMVLGGVGLLGGQAAQGLLSKQVGEDEQGTLQGALTSLASLTGIIGPVIATSLFYYFTRANAPLRIPGIAFFLAAILNLVALAISIRVLSLLHGARPIQRLEEA
jgi:DHA1 family tetracycline resistance protein-like MFS transporter